MFSNTVNFINKISSFFLSFFVNSRKFANLMKEMKFF